MKLGDMQVKRSKSTREAPQTFPSFASDKPFVRPEFAMEVKRSKRGPEKSQPVNVGMSKPRDKAARRELFYPSGSILSLRRGRTPK